MTAPVSFFWSLTVTVFTTLCPCMDASVVPWDCFRIRNEHQSPLLPPCLPSLIPPLLLNSLILPSHLSARSSSTIKHDEKTWVAVFISTALQRETKICCIGHEFTNAAVMRERERKEKGGINRLNDKKEQCCDSEQLVFPTVDRPCFLCVCVYVCTHVSAWWRQIVLWLFISEQGAAHRGYWRHLQGEKKHDKWHSAKCPTSFPPSRYFLLIQWKGLKVNMSDLLANYRRGGKAKLKANLRKFAYRFAEVAAVKSTYLNPKLNCLEANCWRSMMVMCVVIVL